MIEPETTEGALTEALRGLLDDAAMFPPGELPLEAAIPAYERHRTAWYAELVGPFVFPAARLDDLPAVLRAGSPDAESRSPVELSLTVPDGPAAVPGALHSAGKIDGVRVTALEVALPTGMGADDLIKVLDASVPQDLLLYIEVPRDGRRPPVLAALAGTRYRAKFRTGGVVPQAHPSEQELAEAIAAAVRLDVPFKCTAGLHHAVRHTDGNLEQHGFLNVLLAAEAADAGGEVAEFAVLLAERSARTVAARVRELSADRLAAARRRFTSFGTCSVSDPVGDLVALGLLHAPATTEPKTEQPLGER